MNSISVSWPSSTARYFVTGGTVTEVYLHSKSAATSMWSMLTPLTGTDRGMARSMSRVRGDRPVFVAS